MKLNQYKGFLFEEWVEKVLKHMENLGYKKIEKELLSMDNGFFFFESIGKIDWVYYNTFLENNEFDALTPEQFLALTIDDVLVKEELEEKRVWNIEPGDVVLMRSSSTSMWGINILSKVTFSESQWPFIGLEHQTFHEIVKYNHNLKKYNEEIEDIPGAWRPDDLEEIKRQIEERENKPELTIEYLKENLKVGDKVRLKTLEEYEKIPENKRQSVYVHMLKYLGETLEIKDIDRYNPGYTNFWFSAKYLDYAWNYNIIAEHYPQDK